MGMDGHDCVQVDRIKTLEEDVRTLAKTTNGKLDRIWSAVDELQRQVATSRANLKWIAIIVLQLLSILTWALKS